MVVDWSSTRRRNPTLFEITCIAMLSRNISEEIHSLSNFNYPLHQLNAESASLTAVRTYARNILRRNVNFNVDPTTICLRSQSF